MRSPWGRVLRGIREDEDAVRSLGKNVVGYKMQSLVLGGIFGAFAGFVFALANSSVQPDNYGTQFTFLAFTAMILGGAGRVLAPVLGGDPVPDAAGLRGEPAHPGQGRGVHPRRGPRPTTSAPCASCSSGVVLMALMIFRPQGLLGDKKELALDAR